MRGGVQQSEHGVGHQPGVGFGQAWVQLAQHPDPDLHVLSLGLTHLPLSDGRQVR
ncbi:Uncharacterised protein [Mycobacterium tuberculosis]|nr:Uncharacterised protein [Mycobacterium tuberculosis]